MAFRDVAYTFNMFVADVLMMTTGVGLLVCVVIWVVCAAWVAWKFLKKWRG
jgi:hypothetical protein